LKLNDLAIFEDDFLVGAYLIGNQAVSYRQSAISLVVTKAINH